MIKISPEIKKIFKTYWPLAISWLFMAADTPLITAFVSRMNNPKDVLAAHGTAYPLILLIESPVIMLTSASLTLCIDGKNYKRMRKLMLMICALVTFLHALICVPGIFSLIFVRILGAPAELLDYIHTELIFVIPWSGLIGYRRFNQGILIRSGKSGKVTIGTVIRIVTMFISLNIFLALKDRCTGSLAAGFSLTICVLFESLYNGIEGHKTAVQSLVPLETAEPLITWKELILFVSPLILTKLTSNIWMSIGSGAVSRMINPIVSLAVWPVISSLLNILNCWGSAINETALAQLSVKGMRKPLERFTLYVTVFVLLLFLMFALPPMNDIWFIKISSLTPELAAVSKAALPFVILVPLLSPVQNFYQAVLVKGKKTTAIFESLLVFLVLIFSALGIGLVTNRWMGIYVIVLGMSVATAGQVLWLRFRAHQVEKSADIN